MFTPLCLSRDIGKGPRLPDRALLQELREFANLQASLIQALLASSPDAHDEFTLRGRVPDQLSLDGTWRVRVHGVGVRFVRTSPSTVVDAHVGMFEAPRAFDIWRLEQYFRSRRSGTQTSETELRAGLNSLLQAGSIEPAEIPQHFVLAQWSDEARKGKRPEEGERR